MNGKELLEKCPKAAEVIKQWYIAKMKADNLEFSNEFVKVMQEKIGRIIIDNNPRELFDVLDDNDIYVTIKGVPPEFTYSIGNAPGIPWKFVENLDKFKCRKDAEKFAIVDAITMLDNQLS